MRKTLTTFALMAAVGMAAPAYAQQGTNDRDRDTTPTRTTQPRTPGQNDQNQWQRDDQNRDDTNMYRDQDYFGRVGDSSTELGKLNNLAGVWRVTVKRFHHGEGNLEGTNSTSTGYAERRWILDGTKLVEVYTLDGTPDDLPLRAMNSPRGWNSNNPTDGGDWDRDQMHRDNVNPQDRDNRTPGQTRPGTTGDRDNSTTGTPGNRDNTTGDHDGETTGYLDKQPGDPNTTARPGDENRPGDLSRPSDHNSRPGQPGQDQTVLPSRPAENLDPNNRQPGDRTHAMHKKMGAEDKGMVLWGYNENTEEFNVVWTDASTSAIRYDTGKLGDNNHLELTGQYTDPRDNKEYKTRTVIEMTTPTMQKVTMYRDGGLFSSETKIFEITYTKDSQFDSMNNRDNMQNRDGWQDIDRNNTDDNRGTTPRNDRPGNPDRP